MSHYKVKITASNINFGPKTLEEVEEVTKFVLSGELVAKGYRRVSNAYCRVARIDREDWLTVLAKHMNCSVADFYSLNGGGVKDNWRDHYCRVFSKDTLTIAPDILRLIPSWY